MPINKKLAIKILSLITFLILYFLTPKPPSSPPPSTTSNTTTETTVNRVIDGDTIVLSTNEHLRLIGINAPELNSKQCYSSESFTFLKNLVEGKAIKLEKDLSNTDKYGRLLRYVYLDNIFINNYLVENGIAKAEDFPPDSKYKELFKLSEISAKSKNLGLWKCQK